MESQCDYSMYFPAVPFPPREFLAGESSGYRSLPRRNHLYLGETVRFLLVLRKNPGNSDKTPGNSDKNLGNAERSPGNIPGKCPWPQLASALSALATVTSADGAAGARDEDDDEANPGNFGSDARGEPKEPPVFRECRALLTHSRGPPGNAAPGLPVDDPIVSSDEVIFPLTVSLDRLPPGTAKAKIVVTVWQRDTEPPELQDGAGPAQVTTAGPGQVTMAGPGGYLRLLQGRAPGQVFRQQHGAFKAQVSTLLTVLPPPRVRCRQVTVSGKYLTVLKVLNGSSQDELSLWDVQILPNFNASYLPVMPDGSVLLVDDVCHHSGEVPVGAFCRVPGCHSGWPCPLSALEEQNFLFQLQAPERPPRDAKEGARGARWTRWSVTPRSPTWATRARAAPEPSAWPSRPSGPASSSVSSAPPEARPVSRKSSPSSPAVRELLTGLGRSQSFSHQQPARGHLIRSGSVMERRAITPPVGSPVGRPLYLPAGDKAVLALDKIAKRECKVLVVPPVK
ncbi:trafficking protein particle complex subunit 14 isoform X6 [Chamaea fasciata]|uniref:trafficking protein particle complex subunit 14 isoform X6 n=1 Tax=Chamaea fasciata TaxID=190680 RepID=UPI00336A1C35